MWRANALILGERTKASPRTCRQNAWKGKTGMKMNNTRNEMEGLTGRHFAMRDVRFAGTVAAGLVAGVLGVGALTAPLLGWTEWPSSPGQGDQAGTVTLHARPSVSPDTRPSTNAIGNGAAAASAVRAPARPPRPPLG